jgi:hypothetical protein
MPWYTLEFVMSVGLGTVDISSSIVVHIRTTKFFVLVEMVTWQTDLNQHFILPANNSIAPMEY